MWAVEAAPAPWTAPASPIAHDAAPAAIAAPNRRPASARAALSHAQAGNGQFTHGHFGSEGLKPPEAWESAYLAGEYSIADIATYTWVSRHEWHNTNLADFPNVKRWYDAISARPAVQKGMSVPG